MTLGWLKTKTHSESLRMLCTKVITTPGIFELLGVVSILVYSTCRLSLCALFLNHQRAEKAAFPIVPAYDLGAMAILLVSQYSLYLDC